FFDALLNRRHGHGRSADKGALLRFNRRRVLLKRITRPAGFRLGFRLARFLSASCQLCAVDEQRAAQSEADNTETNDCCVSLHGYALEAATRASVRGVSLVASGGC